VNNFSRLIYILVNDENVVDIYKEVQTNINNVLDNFITLVPNMNFALEKEEDNKINFLDITVNKDHDSRYFGTYRIPTTTASSHQTTLAILGSTNQQQLDTFITD